MTKELTQSIPTHNAALEHLNRFVPHAGRDYASRRNFDLGAGKHTHVSCLSPYLRHRIITEKEVLKATLGRHSLQASEKFVQEVFWRTYWKGWLEMRPQIWRDYQHGVMRALDDVQTQSGLRARWESACMGQTGIACFDTWAQELAQTGYLHNHARMWFASIWVFTLELPWELGADFFLRHLLDGDPASNTLSWRWVAGIQTQGKTYLARPDNIAKYTEGRFAPTGLAAYAPPLDAPVKPAPKPLVDVPAPQSGKRTGLVLHNDDLSPRGILEQCDTIVTTFCLTSPARLSPLAPAPHIKAFTKRAMADVTTRWSARMGDIAHGTTATDIEAWAATHGLEQIVTAYAPTGPNADTLKAVTTLPVAQVRRDYDSAAWPFATHGFFKFKDKIPALIARMNEATTMG
jgi:deoxyribodipyrimidine photo-lyase